MKNFLRKKKVSSVLGKNQRKRSFLNFDSIQNILIIFNISDIEQISKVIEDLKETGKTVTAWTTLSKEKQGISLPEGVKAIDPTKDVSWSQSLSKKIIEEFEEAQYDTFIDLTVNEDNILKYLLAINNSQFCIGIRENDRSIYDFVLLKKTDDSLFETYEQIKFYLEKMSS
ncbi:MAG: DUF6913 domain-containing protein [Dysgonomonas sp.]